MSRHRHLDRLTVSRRRYLTGRRAESVASRADGAIKVDNIKVDRSTGTSRVHSLRRLGSGVVVDRDAAPIAAPRPGSLREFLIRERYLVPADPDDDGPPWGRL